MPSLPVSSVFPEFETADPTKARVDFSKFPSRRSVVHSTNGLVACSQPLAAKCGVEILEKGGNAADAAVAVAAALNMTEPGSTGIGGDMFILFWDAKQQKVRGLNGSGRSGRKCNIDAVREALQKENPGGQVTKIGNQSPQAVTVPGAAAGWIDTHELFGNANITMNDILLPAIQLGEGGFPVSEMTGQSWMGSEKNIRKANEKSLTFKDMLKKDPGATDGCRAPRPGEVMRNPLLAKTFRTLADKGKDGFYTGEIAQAIVTALRDRGGLMEMEDLAEHSKDSKQEVTPISLKFTAQGLDDDPKRGRGVEVWEHPPNGQGIIALMALGLMQQFQAADKIKVFGPEDFNSAEYLHAIIEALRISFSDGRWWVADYGSGAGPDLLQDEYLKKRAELFDNTKAIDKFDHGEPVQRGKPVQFQSPALQSCDTVYFAVADGQGNVASFINSNFSGFGTAIIPADCGFTLQNRGSAFSLDSNHPNSIAPRKRPYHTIIPGMVTNMDGSLHSAFGVMGGFMQPQGHVQVLLGQLIGRLNPQQALDAPRISVNENLDVDVEEGMPEATIQGLRDLKHTVTVVKGRARGMFGRGQIIRCSIDPVDPVDAQTRTLIWSAGSDLRADGAVYPAGPVRQGKEQQSSIFSYLFSRPK